MAAAKPAPVARNALPVTLPQRLRAVQTLPQSLGFKRAKTVRMLALLLVEPGTMRSTDELATAMGVSHRSVGTYVHHLRLWLVKQGLPAGLECQCGKGYLVRADVAAILLARLPCLATATALAVAQLRFQHEPRAASCKPDSNGAAVADPFPKSVHHGNEINLQQGSTRDDS
jgi:biotin operon repressor